jgi:trk system potassium uptake protein TrkH
VFEFLGATSFIAHYMLFKYGVKAFFKYYEVRYYILLISIASITVTLDLMLNLGLDILQALRYAVFQVVSIVTTTGYLTVDINYWPPFSKSLLLILMFIGGNICSTGSAIKVGRLVVTFKAMVNELQRLYLPSAIVKPIKIDTHVVEEGLILRILLFISLYLIAVVLGTLTLTSLGYDPFSALSAIASAQGNVGPAYISFQNLNTLSKVVLIMYMWLGRLELIPALSILIPGMWSQAKSKKIEI